MKKDKKFGRLSLRYSVDNLLAIDLKLWPKHTEISYNAYFGKIVFFWRGGYKRSIKIWGRRCICVWCSCNRIRKIKNQCYHCFEVH